MNKILLFSVIGMISIIIAGFTIFNLQSDYTTHILNNDDLIFEHPIIPLDRDNPIKLDTIP